MGIIRRILGISSTRPPRLADCWGYRDGAVEIDLTRAPELSRPGGAMRLEGKGLPVRLLVVREGNDTFRAFENKCAHMGRRLDPLNGKAAVQCCSVGKSTFDFRGQVITGPAKGPVTLYRVEVENTLLRIPIEPEKEKETKPPQ